MNLEDVAKRAKVSTATVSRVLNDVGLVKSSTRARVLKAVRELNYHPNLHARTLAGGKNRTLGMVVSNLENPFFLDIFRALEAEAHRHKYEVVVANTDYRPQRLLASVHNLMGRRPAGLAMIVSEMEPSLMDELAGANIPVVVYDVGATKPNITNIRVNYGKGMEKMARYLHDLGHRRMAFVGHHTSLGPLSVRKKSFVDMMAALTPEIEFTTMVETDSPAGGRQAVRRILASGFRPTAVMCVNDYMAIGVLRELRDQGLSVPGDVSVTGFDNISLAEFTIPTLTTAHIPREKIGKLIFETLVPEQGRGTETSQEILIDPVLMVRESTGPCKAN
ncbi:MAG TPA: LacI family DNA-binding transcriptional regulator [Bryobacteraceae bacterium]|nr:LacI family DNA-binding transcriptional regulator [Bryobacteraceae bacterium]